MSFSALQSLVDDLVRDTSERLLPDSMVRALEAARVRYSEDAPRVLLADVVAVAGAVQPVPVGWVAGVSALRSVEYPVGQYPQAMLPPPAYGVVVTPLGDAIGLQVAVTVGEPIRVAFSAPHELTETPDVCSVPPKHFEAVATWAAALLCDQLAAASAENSDSTIAADRVDYTSPAKVWAARAKAYRDRYPQLVGVPGLGQGEPAALRPACAEADLDRTASDGGTWYRGRRRS